MLGNKEQPNKIAQKKTTIFPSVRNYHVLQTITYYVNMPNTWRAAGALNWRTVLRRYHTTEKTFTSSKMNCTMKKVLLLLTIGCPTIGLLAQTSTYAVFGNWSNSSNWTCIGSCPVGNVPPNPLPSGDTINIATANSTLNGTFVDYVIDAGGVLNVIGNNNFVIGGARLLTNNGTINISSGASLLNNNLFINNGTVNNSGTLNAATGANDTLSNNGTINNNGLIDLSNNGNAVLNNQGIINLFSGSNIFRRANSQFITTGIIRGVGTLTINGSTPFVNDGTIDMANNSVGTITIGGNTAGRNFTNNGTIIVDIGPGDTSDQINVGNAATLGGTLKVEDIVTTGTFDSGTFTIVTATTISGTFMTIEYPNNDPSWDPNYQPAAFVLGYGPMADLLPIELLAFRGKQLGAIIQLHWETATERNNSYVEVQRSRDGKRFEALGRVLGAGNSATLQRYAFTDEQPLAGVNYYRLRQVDFDGKEEYHRVIAVLFREGKSEGTVQVFPTLAQDQITLALPRELQSPAEVLVSDLNGRVLLRHTLGVGTQQHTLQVAQLAAGHYSLRIRTDREEQIARFVKE